MTPNFVYRGKKFSVSLDLVTLPDGRTTHKEIIHHRGAVVILAFPDPSTVVLVRNYRATIGDTLLELPAGTIEFGEDPGLTAQRELEEETGFRAEHWRKLREFLPSPGILNEVMHLYLATGLSPGTTALAEGESLTPEVHPWKDVVQLCLDGVIRDGKTLVGVLLWDRLRN